MPSSGPLSLRELRTAVDGAACPAAVLCLLARFRLWLQDDASATILLASRPRDVAAVITGKSRSCPEAWTKEVAHAFQHTMTTFRDRQSKYQQKMGIANKDAVPAKKPLIPASQLVPNLEICHEKFRKAYAEFHSGNMDRILAAVTKALADLKTSKEYRPLTVVGDGADHIMYVVGLRGSKELQLQSVRLLAEAALHDDTETAFFNNGALEAAMRIGREAADMETRCHAARLFFNLAYLKQNRQRFIDKGGLEHIAHLALNTEGDTTGGHAQKLLLFAAKTLYQLSCLDQCAPIVFQYPHFKAVWLTFARHSAADVRQRAAGVFNKVIDLDIGGARVHHAWCKYMVEEVLYGIMASDTNQYAVQAQEKAKAVSEAEGWRFLE